LLKGKKLETYNISTGTYLGGTSRYDHFLLTTDSLMAVEKSNELLETLEAKNASLVSLN
jgi:sulfur transfer complex TusBCD TusB component (DsrH family)